MKKHELNERDAKQFFTGWICPTCNHVFSPSISICFFCPVDATNNPNEIKNGNSEYCGSGPVPQINRPRDFDV